MTPHRGLRVDGRGLPILVEQAEASDPLPNSADVIVVGAGIIGLLTAIGLKQAGLHPIIIEAANAGSGQSGRNLGFIRVQGRDEAEVALMARSSELWGELSQKIGPQLSFRRSGHVSLASNARDVDRVTEWARVGERFDVDFHQLRGEELYKLCPHLSKSYVFGGFTPRDGQADPQAVMRSLLDHVDQLGIALFQQTPVTSIAINDKSVKGVQTKRGYVKSNAVLLATGAWTSRLLAKAGIALPTHAGVATMAATRPVAPLSESTMWEVGQLGFRQDAGGRIVFGLGGYVDVHVRWEDVRGAISTLPTFWSNRRAMNIKIGRPLLEDLTDVWRGRDLRPFKWAEFLPNDGFVKAGLARLAHMIPSLASELELDAVWTGLIDTTQDFLPAVGTAGVEGLLFVAGLSGHGFGLAPALAEEVTEIMIGNRPEDTKLAHFAPARLKGYKSIHELQRLPREHR
ncbi:FAD-binding oxidoreductase [Rhizobium pusense]|uniref:FAD-binding oxidoreductase n=3 Tax=Agrobacterium TaxID=357 RepID=A0A6H0ZJN9_9HYPH|nr:MULTISPECIES: FAD-dependent oxidoreductase [Rhizobium/Agrobacterium group]KNY31470.1 hypothetical protein AKG12_24045 [Agrobacterium sp. SUL3]MCD4663498.1 FAD-binding oxidoreductase [Agrobacterium sp.]MDH0912505.1 FAD-binding oxidoreductase [Agrobacterium pusense]MDH1098878.1 FAD-binding oxidoreductase [Agrobacterium pusense]MDH1115151.1 FAD-binding oxidoreductase [Agrobacterium pusense]